MSIDLPHLLRNPSQEKNDSWFIKMYQTLALLKGMQPGANGEDFFLMRYRSLKTSKIIDKEAYPLI